jgi:hypothetical protein
VTVNYGSTRTFTITPDTGYHITEVRVDGEAVDIDGFYDEYHFIIKATAAFLNIDADHTLEANFAIKTFPVLTTAGTGGSISPSGTLYLDYGTDQTFTLTPETEYYVADLLIDGVSVGAVETYTLHVTGSHTVEAYFSQDQPTPTPTPTRNPRPHQPRNPRSRQRQSRP